MHSDARKTCSDVHETYSAAHKLYYDYCKTCSDTHKTHSDARETLSDT